MGADVTIWLSSAGGRRRHGGLRHPVVAAPPSTTPATSIRSVRHQQVANPLSAAGRTLCRANVTNIRSGTRRVPLARTMRGIPILERSIGYTRPLEEDL